MDNVNPVTIDRILSLAPAKVLEVRGFELIDKDKTCTLFTPPMLKTLGVSTLSGFMLMLENKVEGFDPKTSLVWVRDHDKVFLVATRSDEYGRRLHYLLAEAPKPEREFRFNQFMPQEEFNIALRSMFVQDEELDALEKLAGNIAKDSELRQEDDGFAQKVSVKSGVHMVETVTMKPRVTLKPFRTFLEVEQPSGDFIFRVKSPEGAGNHCALFEADAGRWKLTAQQNIAAWLEQKIKTSTVEEIVNLPVIV